MLRSACPQSNAEAQSQGKVAKNGWLAVRKASAASVIESFPARVR
jgi:hypothetical protein